MSKQKLNIKNILLVFSIILLGFFLRIWHLDKPEGLWFDEMHTYVEAKMPLSDIFQSFFTKHIHTPLFYILLHFWISIFGEADVVLRILPVIFGTLTIPVIYLCAKELNCNKTAFWAAFFVAINSLLIYYSQELRLYSLSALFSSLIVLFLLKINNNPSKKTFIFLALANAGLLYTHSISFVFVFFEFLIFGIYFFLKNKESFKHLILAGFTTFLLYIPLLFKMFSLVDRGLKTSGIAGQWWSKFTFSKILFAFGDSFSPYLIANSNPPENYLNFIFQNIPFAIITIILIVTPTIIGLYGILKVVYKKQTILGLLLIVCLCFMSVFGYTAMKGKVVYLSRYIIEVTPVFILIFTYGLVNKPFNKFSKTLLSSFIGINLVFLLFMPMSAPKQGRKSGFKPAAAILNKYSLTNRDYFILEGSRKILFHKYFSASRSDSFYEIHNWNVNLFPLFLEDKLSLKEMTDIGYYAVKAGFPEKIEEKRNLAIESIKATDYYKNYLKHKDYKKFIYTYYRNIIGSPNNIFINSRLKEEIFSKINDQNHLVLIINRAISIYPDITEIKEIAQKSESEYKNKILMYMLHSRISHDLIELSSEKLELVNQETAKNWDIYIFKKITRIAK